LRRVDGVRRLEVNAPKMSAPWPLKRNKIYFNLELG